GAAGSAGAPIDLGGGGKISRGFLEDDKTKNAWNLPRALLAKKLVKLILNMLVIAWQAVPSGGKIFVDSVGGGGAIGFKVSATGVNAKIQPAVPSLLTGELSGDNLDAHRIQPFYTGLLAKDCGVKAMMTAEGETVVIAAH